MEAGEQSGLMKFFPRNRIARHVIFWVWVYWLDVLIFGFGYGNVTLFLKLALLEMPPQIFFAYVMMYWIIPRHLKRNKLTETIGLTSLAFLLSGLSGHIIFLLFSAYTPPLELWNVAKIMVRGLYSALKAGIAITIKLAMLWYENEKRVTTLEKTRLESELKMLKDQVNPHFLFNTLNNLYGLVNQNPLHAQESILRLSGILHFMLHESNHRTIPLHFEVKCINDYIELERLRYTDKLSVSINVHEDVRELALAPLTIFPFVENSFKHGVSELLDDAWVNIDLSIYKNNFVFKIENSKHPHFKNPNSNGIGLKNVKRRLELIYDRDHSLQIIDGSDSFLVILKIALTRMEKTDIANYEGEMSYR